MQNIDGFTHDERESIQIMVRSAGWKTLMRQVITPFLQQTNARLDSMGTTEAQTQFYRGGKATIKHVVEAVYKIGQMPDPFTEHQAAFLLTLSIPAGETVVDEQTEEVKKPPVIVPRRQGQSPVL